MVGPFFCINTDELGYKGWISHLISEENAERYGDFLISSISHSDLFDMKFKNIDAEYFDYPRGRVVYNTVTQSHIIYIDKCLVEKIDSVVISYRLADYTVMFDDHYVCKNCIVHILDVEI